MPQTLNFPSLLTYACLAGFFFAALRLMRAFRKPGMKAKLPSFNDKLRFALREHPVNVVLMIVFWGGYVAGLALSQPG